MRVPTGVRLEDYIYSLIANGNIYKFYKTDEWNSLRDEVMREQHYECQRCLEAGRYTRADMVHHVNEVRKVPRLALSKTFVDSEGKEQRNLIALCNPCHEREHDRANVAARENVKRFTNAERW